MNTLNSGIRMSQVEFMEMSVLISVLGVQSTEEFAKQVSKLRCFFYGDKNKIGPFFFYSWKVKGKWTPETPGSLKQEQII